MDREIPAWHSTAVRKALSLAMLIMADIEEREMQI